MAKASKTLTDSAPREPKVARFTSKGRSKERIGIVEEIEDIEDDEDEEGDEDDDTEEDTNEGNDEGNDDEMEDEDEEDEEDEDTENGDSSKNKGQEKAHSKHVEGKQVVDSPNVDSASKSILLNPTAIRKAAEDARRAVLIPAPPSKRMKWDKFEAYYKALTPDMQEHISMYFYRLEPVLDRKQSDPTNPNYIDKFPKLPQKERVIRDHGGGRYMMIVSDVSGTKGKELCRVELDISELDHPAVFDIRELVVGPRANQRIVNKLVAEGKMDPEGNLMPSVGGTRNIQGGLDNDLTKMLVSNLIERVDTLSDSERDSVRRNSGDDSAVTKAIDLAFQGSVKNLEFLANKLSENDPNRTLDMFVKLFGVINATRSGNGGSDQTTTVLLKMMEMQNQQNQANMTMFQAMMESSRAKGGEGDSELTGVEKTLTILSSMREFVGGGGSGGGGRGRNSIWETAIEHLAPVLGQGLDLAKTMMAARSMGIAGGGLGGQVTNPGPIRRSDLGSRIAQPSDAGASESHRTISSGEMQARRIAAQNQQTGDEMPQTEQPLSSTSSAHAQLVNAIRQNGGFIIHALNTGQSGVDMALNLIGLGMRSLYLQIKSQGSDALLAAMKDVPEFWNVAAGQFTEDVVVKFVDEFIHAEELAGEDDDEEGEEDSMDIPTPKPSGKKGGK